MKSKEKILILSLILLNLLFFEFSSDANLNKAKAEEAKAKSCESLNDFETDFVTQLKSEANPETLKDYAEVIKEQVAICTEERLKEKIGPDYEKLKNDSTFGKTNIRDIIYAKTDLEIKKNTAKNSTETEINTLTKARLINNSVVSRFLEGLNEIKSLSEKYFIEQKKDASETKSISNSIPSQQNTCI